MSDSKWDDMFKQYSEFEKEPANDRWNAIAQELDKDSKRRFGFWWIFGLGAAASSIAVLLMFWPSSSENAQVETPTQQNEIPSETAKSAENTLVNTEVSTTETVEHTESLNTTKSTETTSTPNTQPASSERKAAWSGSTELSQAPLESTEPFQNTLSGNSNKRTVHSVTALNSADPENWTYKYAFAEAVEVPIQHKRPQEKIEEKNDDSTPKRKINPERGFVLGIQSSLALSNFSPSVNAGADVPVPFSNYIQDNLALRKELESGGYSISQGLLVGYRFNSFLSLHTGVRLIQTTQVLRYSLMETPDDPINAPQDLPEGGKSVSPSYQLPNQRIIAGNDYHLNNKYYGREIPLSFQLDVKLNNKFRLLGQVGGSYRWISSGILYFPDIDNVGMLSLNNPTDYPGIRSTWHTHLGVGVSYELNHGFRISAMPYANMALNSNIRFDRFIQQRQQEFGLNISLVRNIQIGQ
ncbi:MAG: hypothetical protein EP332_14855 [Bacteroidetes bacterium]|nr:MAG: hypothetical protein EP332_14855 [Bacteroidota bacterium]